MFIYPLIICLRVPALLRSLGATSRAHPSTISKHMPAMLGASALTIRKPLLILWVIFLLAGASSRAQLDSDASSKDAQAAQGSGAEDIVPFLNQTIVWSRQLSAQQQLVNEPSDALFLNDSRQIADQIVRLAFEFAQALASQPETGASSQPQSASSQYQRLIDSVARADQKVKQSQKELDLLRQQL